MTHKFKKLTLSVATSALLVGNAFALDSAITNFGYVGGNNIPLSIFDASDPTKIKSISGLGYSDATAIDPTGKYFDVTDAASANISKFDALSGTLVGTPISVGSNPAGITLNKDGSKAYVANGGSDTISVIDTTSNSVISTISVDFKTAGITLNKDNSIAYVTNQGSGTVSVIDTTSNIVTATITVGDEPLGVVLGLDGSKAYVANSGGTVSVIDTQSNTVINTITGIDSAYGISISPDGSKLYVRSCYSDKLFTINTSDYSVTTYTGYGSNFAFNISPFISPNLITGTLEIASAAQMLEKGFDNYVNFAGGTLKATGSFTLSNPVTYMMSLT